MLNAFAPNCECSRSRYRRVMPLPDDYSSSDSSPPTHRATPLLVRRRLKTAKLEDSSISDRLVNDTNWHSSRDSNAKSNQEEDSWSEGRLVIDTDRQSSRDSSSHGSDSGTPRATSVDSVNKTLLSFAQARRPRHWHPGPFPVADFSSDTPSSTDSDEPLFVRRRLKTSKKGDLSPGDYLVNDTDKQSAQGSRKPSSQGEGSWLDDHLVMDTYGQVSRDSLQGSASRTSRATSADTVSQASPSLAEARRRRVHQMLDRARETSSSSSSDSDTSSQSSRYIHERRHARAHRKSDRSIRSSPHRTESSNVPALQISSPAERMRVVPRYHQGRRGKTSREQLTGTDEDDGHTHTEKSTINPLLKRDHTSTSQDGTGTSSRDNSLQRSTSSSQTLPGSNLRGHTRDSPIVLDSTSSDESTHHYNLKGHSRDSPVILDSASSTETETSPRRSGGRRRKRMHVSSSSDSQSLPSFPWARNPDAYRPWVRSKREYSSRSTSAMPVFSWAGNERASRQPIICTGNGSSVDPYELSSGSSSQQRTFPWARSTKTPRRRTRRARVGRKIYHRRIGNSSSRMSLPKRVLAFSRIRQWLHDGSNVSRISSSDISSSSSDESGTVPPVAHSISKRERSSLDRTGRSFPGSSSSLGATGTSTESEDYPVVTRRIFQDSSSEAKKDGEPMFWLPEDTPEKRKRRQCAAGIGNRSGICSPISFSRGRHGTVLRRILNSTSGIDSDDSREHGSSSEGLPFYTSRIFYSGSASSTGSPSSKKSPSPRISKPRSPRISKPRSPRISKLRHKPGSKQSSSDSGKSDVSENSVLLSPYDDDDESPIWSSFSDYAVSHTGPSAQIQSPGPHKSPLGLIHATLCLNQTPQIRPNLGCLVHRKAPGQVAVDVSKSFQLTFS